MTPDEARKVKVGTRVKWESSDERGKVVEKGAAGLRVAWDDGQEAIYLFLETSHGLKHLVRL